MGFQLVLSESDLRKMDQALREKLLKWYFDQDRTPSPASDTINATVPLRSADSDRVSFPELMRAGLLPEGTEIYCRALKRQKRSGTKTHLEAGKVLTDGSVQYRGKQYLVPSKLAVDVVNTNGGSTKAINGYQYLFIRESNRPVHLQELRERFFKQQS